MTRPVPKAVCAIERGVCWIEKWGFTLFGIAAALIFAVIIVAINLAYISLMFPAASFPWSGTLPGPITEPAGIGMVGLASFATLGMDAFLLVIAGCFLLNRIYGDDWRERCHRARTRGGAE